MLQRFRNTLRVWRAARIVAVTLAVGLMTGAAGYVFSLWEEAPVDEPTTVAVEAAVANAEIGVNSVAQLDRLDAEGRLGEVTVLISPQEWFLDEPPEEAADAGPVRDDTAIEKGRPAKHTLLDVLPKMPRLRVLLLGPILGDSADETMQLIGKMEDLDSLMIADSTVESRHLKHLVGLKKLKFLDLSQCDLSGGLESLSELPALRVFGYRDPLATNELAADLLAVPQIETLHLHAKYQPGSIMDAGIKSLAAHPGLKEIVLSTEIKGARGNRLRKLLTDRNPHIAIRKLKSKDDELPMWFVVVLVMATILLIGIHAQLMKHLAMPLAGVIPGYGPKQVTFPFVLVVAFCVVGIFVLMLIEEATAQVALTVIATAISSLWLFS
jgi:hypothetical protein